MTYLLDFIKAKAKKKHTHTPFSINSIFFFLESSSIEKPKKKKFFLKFKTNKVNAFKLK